MRDIANQPGSGISHPKAAMHPVAPSKLVAPEPRGRSKGGQASSGSFPPGDPRVREAGHNGGLSGPED